MTMNIETIINIVLVIALVVNLIVTIVARIKTTEQKHDYVLTFVQDNNQETLMVITVNKYNSLVSGINMCYTKFAATDKLDARLTDIKKL